MAKVFDLASFRGNRDVQAAVVSDDGTEVQRSASAPATLALTPAASTAAGASVSERSPSETSNVMWRSDVHETICRLNWDYEELVARLAKRQGPAALFKLRREALQPAIDEIYTFFPSSANGNCDPKLVLAPWQQDKLKAVTAQLSQLVADIQAALRVAAP